MLTQSRVSPELLVLAATLGNTLVALTNVIIGRLLPALKPQRGLATALRWLQRLARTALLLSWVPVVGDLLCVLAGWLRMPWGSVALFLCIGKRFALHRFGYDNGTGHCLVAVTREYNSIFSRVRIQYAYELLF